MRLHGRSGTITVSAIGFRDTKHALVTLALAAIASTAPASELATLGAWMTGSFSSQEQAAAGDAYFDIRLTMVPIWRDRADGPWLYVEQAAAESLERPYRQRVYHLAAQEDGSFRSEVYTLPEPLRFAGRWREREPLAELSPGDLELRAGCAVILEKVSAESFRGGTAGKDCASELRGASYATSEVEVRPDRITSWDRGFDAGGEQVWGAEKGPYVFLRAGTPAAEPSR